MTDQRHQPGDEPMTVDLVRETPPEAAPPGRTPEDIYFVLFRHKWKIGLGVLAGIAAVLGLFLLWPKTYQSEAKLLVLYVTESRRPVEMAGSESLSKSPDQRGETILQTEMEILTSLDLARDVAELIGPERIVGEHADATNLNAAAGVILRNLSVEAPRHSKVIQVKLEHPDAALIQPILSELINTYLKRHVEIHRSVGMFGDVLTRETDQLRTRLLQTDEALRQAKTRAGVVSVEGAKEDYRTQMARSRQMLFETEARLAERRALAEELRRMIGPASDGTNQAGKAAAPEPEGGGEVEAADALADVPAVDAEYRRTLNRLEMLTAREQHLLLQFTGENALVKSVQDQIAGIRQRREQMETEHPGLVGQAPKGKGERQLQVDPVDTLRPSLTNELALITGLESKMQVLSNQLSHVQQEIASLDQVEGEIVELQRRKEMEESRYRMFAQSKEQGRIDEALGDGRVSNINVIQAPSPPAPVVGRLYQFMALGFLGMVAAAIALACGIEFVFDRSVRSPTDVERRLALPFCLAIPRMRHARRPRRLRAAAQDAGAPATAGSGGAGEANLPATVAPSDNGKPAPWESLPEIKPSLEILRDSLIDDFEMRGLTRNPKLVGVTGCADGAGVTTIAGGLAAALSKAGDGNVLLVDMKTPDGKLYHFHPAARACGLEEVLADGKCVEALIQDNLYVASGSAHGNQLAGAQLKSFDQVAPRLKASDYDYVVLDLPPLHRATATARLVRLLDTVVLVAESEKTDRDTLKRASSLLGKAEVKFQVVLNKHRRYVPRWLHEETTDY